MGCPDSCYREETLSEHSQVGLDFLRHLSHI